MIKAVILDWSGVLSDDLAIVHETTARLFARLGMKFMGLPEFRERFDLPYMDFYKNMGVGMGQRELDRMYKDLFLSGGRRPKPFPFAREVLEMLREKKVKLAVYSSHPEELLAKEISEYGFSGFFEVSIGGVQDKRKRIGKLPKKLGATPEETLLVGDMAHDIEAGRTAGFRTAAVLSGYHTKERLGREEPNFLLNDIRDLGRVLEWFS